MSSVHGDLGVRHLTCPLCGSVPGHQCVTVRGRRPGTPTLTHGPRSQPFRDAWWEGLREGKVHGGRQALWKAAGGLKPTSYYTGGDLKEWLLRLAESWT